MSLDAVLEILRERGLRIRIREDGRPCLQGPKEEITDVLRDALAAYRDEIVERFKPTIQREFLWPDGAIAVSCLHLANSDYPVSAWYWRWQGESDWWPIPGKTWSGELTEAQRQHAQSAPANRAAVAHG